jgi:5-hydroxyisourate hydrolase-like protein (transthyretin family)
MPLVTAPFFALNSQYRPNVFIMSMASSNPLVMAEAVIAVDTLSTTILQKAPAYDLGGVYYFVFDVAKVLQTQSAPKAQNKTTVFLNTINASYQVASPDIHTQVGLIVTYYYNDPVTGLLTQFVTTDTIMTAYPAIAGTRQTRDWNNMGMTDYVIDYPTVGGIYDRYWLTNLPYVHPTASTKTNNPIPICSGENLTMSYVPSSTTNALRVVVYDADQNVVGTAGFIQIIPGSTLTPRTIGAGIQQLLATTMTPSNPMTAIQTGYYYSIQAGNLTLPSTFVLQGVKYMFKVVECCGERSTRLHWLNRLGGADAYTFKSKKKVEEKTKSETAQKPLGWASTVPPATSYDKGVFKIFQETTKEYEVESTFYDESWGAWIAELLSSPEVYMETSNGLIAVIITDSSITLSENDELLNITIQFTEANYISVQSN